MNLLETTVLIEVSESYWLNSLIVGILCQLVEFDYNIIVLKQLVTIWFFLCNTRVLATVD